MFAAKCSGKTRKTLTHRSKPDFWKQQPYQAFCRLHYRFRPVVTAYWVALIRSSLGFSLFSDRGTSETSNCLKCWLLGWWLLRARVRQSPPGLMMILFRFRAAVSICVRGTRHDPISIQIIWPFVDVPILLLLDVHAPVPIWFNPLQLSSFSNDCPCIWWLVMYPETRFSCFCQPLSFHSTS